MHLITHLEQALAALPPQPTIVIHTGFAEPALLTAQLAECAPRLSGARVYVFMPMGDAPYASPEATQHLQVHAFFPGKALRKPIGAGRVTPNMTRFSQVPDLFARGEIRADLLLLQVSEADAQGRHSLGLAVDYMPAVLAQQPVVVAEVNPQVPRTHGSTWLAPSQLQFALAHDAAPLTSERAQGDALEQQIAQHVAGLVESGDVLQLGIGALPDLVLGQVSHLQHLGLHSGILGDAVRPLIESGVVDNSSKREHAGTTITTMVGGSADFYRWLHDNPAVQLHPCNHTHGLSTLAAIDQLCCINSVLQMDLSGRANAQSVGGRLISTPGGLLDFARGARAAARGKSIIALRSANADATVSNILRTLDPQDPVSLQASDIDHVVTEYGVATLRGQSPEGVARALRAIAHPNFREDL